MLSTLQVKLVGAALVVALVAALGSGFVAEQRAKGALAVRLTIADSAHRADSVESVRHSENFARSVLAGDTLRAILRAHQGDDRAARRRVDSLTSVLGSARDAALAAERDSTATVVSLRSAIGRLVTASDSSEAAHTAVEVVLRRDLADRLRLSIRDSLTIGHGAEALASATRRAVDSERQVSLYRKQGGGVATTIAKYGGTAIVAFLAGRSSK
jgi:hypothetical protein